MSKMVCNSCFEPVHRVERSRQEQLTEQCCVRSYHWYHDDIAAMMTCSGMDLHVEAVEDSWHLPLTRGERRELGCLFQKGVHETGKVMTFLSNLQYRYDMDAIKHHVQIPEIQPWFEHQAIAHEITGLIQDLIR